MVELATRNPTRHPEPVVRADALAYLMFERPDLSEAQRFFQGFGLDTVQRDEERLYLRARDGSPFCVVVHSGARAAFLGLGLHVPKAADLQTVARRAASAIEPTRAPGGGTKVCLEDPSGFQVEVVHGQRAEPQRDCRLPLVLNAGGQAPSRVDQFQRAPSGPSQVSRLGHVVVEVASFQATCAWYTEWFGLIPSDVQVFSDGTPAVVFLRLDRGDEPTDHHTLAIAQGIAPRCGHCAFEVVDLDAIALGAEHLLSRGFRRAWGVGRHLLGSQIFDYWRDPWGELFEHYTDGDVCTASAPMGIFPVSRDAMAQWGPAMPADFTRPRLTRELVRAVAHNLRTSPDLSVGKLAMLARIFG